MIPKATVLSPKRRRTRAARTKRLLETAMALVVNEGVEALTVHRLAKELNYTAGALYRYFPSKDAILAELQERVVLYLHKSLKIGDASAIALASAENLSPVRTTLLRLLVSAGVYRSMATVHTPEFHLLSVSISDPRQLLTDEIARPLMASVFDLLNTTAKHYENAVAAGSLEPGHALDRAILQWSGLQGILQLEKYARFNAEMFDIERLVAGSLKVQLLGQGASADEVDAAAALLSDHFESLVTRSFIGGPQFDVVFEE